jgi:hypothetical protein
VQTQKEHCVSGVRQQLIVGGLYQEFAQLIPLEHRRGAPSRVFWLWVGFIRKTRSIPLEHGRGRRLALARGFGVGAACCLRDGLGASYLTS